LHTAGRFPTGILCAELRTSKSADEIGAQLAKLPHKAVRQPYGNVGPVMIWLNLDNKSG
jgi:hypothetical protein